MKHAKSSLFWPDGTHPGPKHSNGWTLARMHIDKAFADGPYNPARHAKPFGKHHPARPVTYDATGATTPLNPPTHRLDTVA